MASERDSGYFEGELRHAVGAGLISEAQALRLIAHEQARSGLRQAGAEGEESFEFLSSFSEFFISIGLTILCIGLLKMSVFGIILIWLLAEYIVLKRRLLTPSIVLNIFFLIACFWAAWSALIDPYMGSDPLILLGVSALGLLAAGAFFMRFRLPFALFSLGCVGVLFALTGREYFFPRSDYLDFADIFSPILEGGNDLFLVAGVGLLYFILALRFDMADRYRVTNSGKNAFWLFLVAAPALVHPLAVQSFSMSLVEGNLYLLVVCILFGLVALVLDRRSFMVSTLIYLAILLGKVLVELSADFFGALLLFSVLLGGYVTVIGLFWVPLRAWIMRILPGQRWKERLSPVGGSAVE